MLIWDFYKNILRISDKKVIERLLKVTRIKKLKKGEFLIRAGDQQDWWFFLVSGLFRGFLLDANGRDISECFCYQAGTAVISGLGLQEPSPINFEALADSEVLCIKLSEVLPLLEENTELLTLYNRILLAAMRAQRNTQLALSQYSGRQRYQWFLKSYPALVGRVSDKHIASFLGMTPVTLSRLRRAMREESESV